MDESGEAAGRPSRLLFDLAHGRLEPHEVEAVELWLRAGGLEEPPVWVRRRAERLATQYPRVRAARAPDWPGAARRILAALAFDSSVDPQFVGLRASGTHVRRLLFQAENIEVDLEMTPSSTGRQVRLAGQVTAGRADPSGGYLRLSHNGAEWRAALDSAGEFRLEAVEPGAYRLEIVLGDRIVEVPVIPI